LEPAARSFEYTMGEEAINQSNALAIGIDVSEPLCDGFVSLGLLSWIDEAGDLQAEAKQPCIDRKLDSTLVEVIDDVKLRAQSVPRSEQPSFLAKCVKDLLFPEPVDVQETLAWFDQYVYSGSVGVYPLGMFIRERKALCDQAALLYKVLCDELAIACTLSAGYLGKGCHAWCKLSDATIVDCTLPTPIVSTGQQGEYKTFAEAYGTHFAAVQAATNKAKSARFQKNLVEETAQYKSLLHINETVFGRHSAPVLALTIRLGAMEKRANRTYSARKYFERSKQIADRLRLPMHDAGRKIIERSLSELRSA
jgi:hypothetical protein